MINMNVEEFKLKYYLIYFSVLALVKEIFNIKIDGKIIYMIITYHIHSKNTDNLKFMES